MSYLRIASDWVKNTISPLLQSLNFKGIKLDGASAKAATVAFGRFVGAPGIWVAQQFAAKVKPVTPQMAIASAVIWSVAILATAFFAFRPKAKLPTQPQPDDEQAKALAAAAVAANKAAHPGKPDLKEDKQADAQVLQEAEQQEKRVVQAAADLAAEQARAEAEVKAAADLAAEKARAEAEVKAAADLAAEKARIEAEVKAAADLAAEKARAEADAELLAELERQVVIHGGPKGRVDSDDDLVPNP
jgi:hypothetical protein